MAVETKGFRCQAVMQHLHRGRALAIKGYEIARRLGYKDDRLVRIAIRQLIADGVPVASSVQEPQGYYIVESYQEALAYMAVLRSRLIEDALRRRDFKLAAYKYFEGAKQKKLL